MFGIEGFDLAAEFDVDVNHVLSIRGVPAGQYRSERQAELARRGKHELVASFEAIFGQHEVPELVMLERVGARDVENKVEFTPVERLLDAATEQREVLVISGAVIQPDIEAASLFDRIETLLVN